MDTLNQNRLELQFVNLISALAASAMQQLGKLVNPVSGKTEVNLAGAKSSIDLLEMLQAKTKGNLNKDEAKLLQSTLSNLQLNYIDESSKPTDESKKVEGEPEK
jgi:hypothetical protein